MRDENSELRLRSYIKAVGRHWVELMSGGLITVALGFLERGIKRDIPLSAFLLVVFFFILLACFRAWRDAKKDALEDQRKLSEFVEAAKERFNGSRIEHVRFVEIGSQVIGVFFLQIRNIGLPSVAEGFHITLSLVDGRQIVPDVIVIVKDLHMNDGTILRCEDNIQNRVTFTPVQTGAMVPGLLFCQIEGATQQEVNQPGLGMLLEFHDINGNPYQVRSTLTHVPDVPLVLPGLQSTLGKPLIIRAPAKQGQAQKKSRGNKRKQT